MTYVDYACGLIRKSPVGAPLYTKRIAQNIATNFALNLSDAAAAAAVAIKRIMDNKIIPELRFYQKGIYFRTSVTPFGEVGIDKKQLIADKYLLPNKGYETGLYLLFNMGITTQMPNECVIATNAAKQCARKDKKLGVVIKPPKVEICAENKVYLQTLDALDCLSKAPVDAENPYRIIANYINENDLCYEKLLSLAYSYYGKNTIMQLAQTAAKGSDEQMKLHLDKDAFRVLIESIHETTSITISEPVDTLEISAMLYTLASDEQRKILK